MNWIQKTKELTVSKILGAKDTPHRIAFGVFLGFLVGWTPTMGLQIAIYLTLATLLRANKVSGIPMVFISNPFTAVPLYYTAWKGGHWILHGRSASRPTNQKPFGGANDNTLDNLSNLLHPNYSPRVYEAMVHLGTELWVGSLALGVVSGVIGYAVTYHAVIRYKRNSNRPL